MRLSRPRMCPARAAGRPARMRARGTEFSCGHGRMRRHTACHTHAHLVRPHVARTARVSGAVEAHKVGQLGLHPRRRGATSSVRHGSDGAEGHGARARAREARDASTTDLEECEQQEHADEHERERLRPLARHTSGSPGSDSTIHEPRLEEICSSRVRRQGRARESVIMFKKFTESEVPAPLQARAHVRRCPTAAGHIARCPRALPAAGAHTCWGGPGAGRGRRGQGGVSVVHWHAACVHWDACRSRTAASSSRPTSAKSGRRSMTNIRSWSVSAVAACAAPPPRRRAGRVCERWAPAPAPARATGPDDQRSLRRRRQQRPCARGEAHAGTE